MRQIHAMPERLRSQYGDTYETGTPERYAEALETFGHGKPLAMVGADMSALTALASFIAQRATDVLPSADPAQAMAYYVALVRHSAIGSSETFSECLASVLEGRINADDIQRGAMFASAEPFGYLAPDETLLAVAPDSHAATGKRSAGVRGDVDVIDSQGNRANSAELIARANMLMRASGESVELIGTDTYGYRNSWEQVVYFKPDVIALVQGVFAFRPDGSGNSIVGGASTRKRVPFASRRAVYGGQSERVFIGATRAEDTTLTTRLRSRFTFSRSVSPTDLRTFRERSLVGGRSLAIPANDTRYVIGHGRWQLSESAIRERRQSKVRAERKAIPTLNLEQAADYVSERLESAYVNRETVRVVANTANGYRIAISHVPDSRRYVVNVSLPKPEQGARKVRSVTVKSLASAMNASKRLAS